MTPLQTYNGPTVDWARILDIIEAHKIVTKTGLPNFMAARILVQGQLNIKKWKKYLCNYWDNQLIDLLTFGFPLDFDRSVSLHTTLENHKSAQQFPDQVQEYVETEIHHGAILGPFKDPPFKIHVSPLMTRPKHDSNKRRTILDLSWPKGASVNGGVTPDVYLNTYFKLTYPSIDNITQKLKELGPGAMFFKIDISRAFRHIRIDPKDIDLLGIHHNDAYIDTSLAFGFVMA